ncbi:MULTISPECIES: glycerophosphodiester phosphodiesterase [Paenibacillus]|nr:MULTISPECIES: glycerophosphodiester phosphodiesterase [Paenibacillus]MCM3339645.1 glycerophosphodiester phosphodiesterase [Paenibacillus sp. MER TA 81-3]
MMMMFVFAHRGASGYAPENTMAAFRKAVDMGCDGIELDIQQTKDGRLVIIHDENVKRTTNGSGYVADCTYEELCKLDAGSWFHSDFAKERLPLLDDYLDAIADTGLMTNIEIKNVPFFYKGIEQKLIQALSSRGMLDRVIVSSFDHYALATIAELEPRIKLGVLFGDRLFEPANYIRSLPFPVYSVHPHFSFANEAFISACHDIGSKVYAYTVDRPEWAVALRSAGIDGIFSNVPNYVKVGI